MQAQVAQVVDAELAEHALVLGEYLLGRVRGRGDQHDPGALTPAELDEPLQQAGPAAAVLGTADYEQPTWRSPAVHVLALVPDPARSTTQCYPASQRSTPRSRA